MLLELCAAAICESETQKRNTDSLAVATEQNTSLQMSLGKINFLPAQRKNVKNARGKGLFASLVVSADASFCSFLNIQHIQWRRRISSRTLTCE